MEEGMAFSYWRWLYGEFMLRSTCHWWLKSEKLSCYASCRGNLYISEKYRTVIIQQQQQHKLQLPEKGKRYWFTHNKTPVLEKSYED